MAVKIEGVAEDSFAFRAGIEKGDVLEEINGHEIYDILDFRFFETNSVLKIKLNRKNGETKETIITKGEYESTGMLFETYLMDKQHSCRNKCIFCFIDQLPKGMRPSLYFKDDDERLSFLFGNYITLTNLSERETDRIISMHISPVNISVHTTNPALRSKMMGNRFAGESLSALYKFAKGGIKINCQLVLCPGINDGDELRRTLSDLYNLGESILSIACVPVGVTRYRENLFPLSVYNRETAADTIDIIEAYGEKFKARGGSRVVYPSDEFFLIAARDFPPYDYYEDFPQIENGVGMFADMKDGFDFALESHPALLKERKITAVTGEGAAEFIDSLLKKIEKQYPGFSYKLAPVKNDFFGGSVNVSGLLTGTDIEKSLKGRVYGEEIIIPGCALRHDDDIFLDDVRLSELSSRLGAPITTVSNDGEEFLYKALGISHEHKKGGYTYPENIKV